MMIVGIQVLLIGLLADLISANRKLLEDVLSRVRRLELPANPERERERPQVAHAADHADRWEH